MGVAPLALSWPWIGIYGSFSDEVAIPFFPRAQFGYPVFSVFRGAQSFEQNFSEQQQVPCRFRLWE